MVHDVAVEFEPAQFSLYTTDDCSSPAVKETFLSSPNLSSNMAFFKDI